MARGQRDYGAYAAETYMGAVSDMAELAVRLGSIVIFDRRGKVIDLDDCEGAVLKFFITIAGDGAAVLDSTNPKSGSQDIKLTSGTGFLNHALIEKRFPPLSSQRLGIEVGFSRRDTDTDFLIELIYYDGTNSHLALITIDFNAGTISYRTAAGADTLITTYGPFPAGTFLYYPIKLVVDFATDRYARLLFAGVEYDLSTLALRVVANAALPHISYGADLRRRAATGGDLYVDDFILTEDEP